MIRIPSSIEPLEARIAPAALTIINPLPDVTAGAGKTGATVELTEMFDGTVDHPNHTLITFTVNLDSDPSTPGIQPSTFIMELFDDEAPLTVQNFLSYVQNPDTARDFIGTFFHRSIDNFIVQGGGFDVSNPSKHLAIGPEVHNEFSASRSNLTGTVAMAKTGLGPNTATSEWFVNLADNSSNLDNQNGGFTVFGQIISGLDVFTKINALPTINQGGALTDLPVQNYNSDPDHNPNTPAPKPNANQLIRITNVSVAPPATGDATDYTFTVPVDGNSNPGLVTATIVGGKLKLAYAPGKSGEADVTVHVVKGADSVDAVVHVKVLPNLIANVSTDPLPNIIVPGDIGTAVVKLTNNGSGKYTSTTAGELTTNVDVTFYLSKKTDTEESGTVVDPSDIVVGSLTNQPIKLGGGASTTISVPIAVPQELIDVEGVGYHLIARVTPSAGSTPTDELFAVGDAGDDNTAVDGKVHALVNKVGTVSVTNFGNRTIPKLSFIDHDGDPIVVSITGPGTVDVVPDGDEFSLSVTNSSILTTLAVRAKASTVPGHTGRVELHNTNVDSAIGTLNLAGADIDGYTTLSGGVQTLSTGKLSGDHTLLIGALLPTNATRATITLGQVTDYNLESDQPIGLLTAVNWHDNMGDDDHIIAPVIDRLNIKGAPAVGATPKVAGDFAANVSFEGRAKMSLFRVAGFFQDATFTALKSAGVDAVSVGGMQHANFFLGTDARPDDLGDFTKARTIGSFTVTGAAAAGDVFIDSQVAAATIGAIKVVRVATASGTADFGFVADTIASYVRNGVPQLLNLTKGQFDHVGNYSVITLPFEPPVTV